MTKDEMKRYARRRGIILRWHKEGKPLVQIARDLGMKRQRVWQIVNKK